MVFSKHSRRVRAKWLSSGFTAASGRFEVKHARVVSGHRLGLDAAQHRCAASFVHVGVGVMPDDVLVAPARNVP